MRNTVLQNIAIIIGVIIGLIAIAAMGLLVYFRYFAFAPDKGGMEAAYFLLTVTPYNSGTNEFGESVGYGNGESREYEITTGDIFYENFDDTLVQNPRKSELPNTIGLLFQVISLDADKVTLLINQEERTVGYGEEFVVYSLLQMQDGASTSYRMQITP